MKKRIKISKNIVKLLVLLLIVSTTLSGCKLAKEETDLISSQDKLVGIYISTDKSLNDLIEKEKDKKIYAIKEKDENPDFPRYKYSFDSIEIMDGDYIFLSKQKIDDARYFLTYTKRGANIRTTEKSTDENIKQTKIEADFFVNANIDEDGFLIASHKIYQDDNGDIYISDRNGSFIHCSSENYDGDDDSWLVVGFEPIEDRTINNLGEKTIEKSEVKVNIMMTYPCQNYKIIEMNDNNEILSSRSFKTEKESQEIKISKDTDYVILEKEIIDKNKKSVFKRSIINKNKDEFKEPTIIYSAKDNEQVFCDTHKITFVWQ